jgi:hypothetical protein
MNVRYFRRKNGDFDTLCALTEGPSMPALVVSLVLERWDKARLLAAHLLREAARLP